MARLSTVWQTMVLLMLLSSRLPTGTTPGPSPMVTSRGIQNTLRLVLPGELTKPTGTVPQVHSSGGTIERAQAIMLSAGNGPPAPTRPSALDSLMTSQPYGTTAISHSSPDAIVSSQKIAAAKVVNLLRPVSATTLPPGTVPQLRKKVWLDFVEKRKERRVIYFGIADNKD